MTTPPDAGHQDGQDARAAAALPIAAAKGAEFFSLGLVLGPPREAWAAAASRRGITPKCADPVAGGFAAVDGDRVVFDRPHQHIAWVGVACDDPDDILDSALGGFVTRSSAPSSIS